jgi:H+/gluconate symporter-like permease
MIPIRLIGILFKTGTKLFEDRQKYKQAMSEAKLLHAEKIKNGEIEYQEKIIETHNNGIKEEIVLFLVSIPFLILVWATFTDNPDASEKLNQFFEKFSNLPMWYQALFIGICSAIYGLKGADIFKRK